MNNPLAVSIETDNQLILIALKSEPKTDHPNQHIGFCPVHETPGKSNPSLLIYENTNGYLGFSCLSKHCSSQDIVKAIKDKFDLTVPYVTKKLDTKDSSEIKETVNYPAHESSLPLKYRKDGDIIYEYTLTTGEIAFLVQRYLSKDNKGNINKEIRPFFSKTFTSSEGISQKDWSPTKPPLKGRPIFNLFGLHNTSKPILIVEGEKTAEAVRHIRDLKDKFTVTTWSGGTAAIHYSDWSVLKDKTNLIYLWPDADAVGLKAMKQVASLISTGFNDTRFYLLDYTDLGLHEVEKGWDLADEAASPQNPYSIEEMIAGFKLYKTEDISGDLEDEIDILNKEIDILNFNGSIFYFTFNKSNPQGLIPYRFWKGISALKTERGKTVIVEGDKPKEVNTVEFWDKHQKKELFAGLDYYPKEQKILVQDGNKIINMFTGFPTFSSERNDKFINLFNDFMSKIIFDTYARTWLIDQLRLSLQSPTTKPGSAIVLIGQPGTGKSSFARIWSTVLGDNNSKYLGVGSSGEFNDVMARSLLVSQDEFEIDHRKQRQEYNRLKTWITEPRIHINPKGMTPFEVRSFHRFVFTSNSLKPISLPPDDRRFFLYSVNPILKGNKSFFRELYNYINEDARTPEALASLQGFTNWLRETAITTDVMEVPRTETKQTLTTISNPILEELRLIYDMQEIPDYIANYISVDELKGFKFIDVRISQPFLREQWTKKYGTQALAEVHKILTDKFMIRGADGLNTKAERIEVFNRDNKTFDWKITKCYHLWPIMKGREVLNEIAGMTLNWTTSLEDTVVDMQIETKKLEVIKGSIYSDKNVL